jgi:hypothetical protein
LDDAVEMMAHLDGVNDRVDEPTMMDVFRQDSFARKLETGIQADGMNLKCE